MAKLTIELCPETGICSLVRADGSKADLVPDEVAALRYAGTNAEKIRSAIADSDASFAHALTEEELKQIAAEIR